MDDRLWLVPAYYKNFKCKCGACRHACCKDWKIAVTEREYYTLIGLDCSERLHEKLECAFAAPDFQTADRFRLIELDWRGQCRMLDEDGLCMLQKECGEEYLPGVCRAYPRSIKRENTQYRAVCSASCEGVCELLLDGDSLKFELLPLEVDPEFCEDAQSDYKSLNIKVVELLQNSSLSMERRILDVFEFLECPYEGPKVNSHSVCASVSDDTGTWLARVLDAMKTFCEECKTLEEYAFAAVERYSEDGAFELFISDRMRLFERFPECESFFENLICNNMFYSCFPYTDPRITKADGCYGIVFQYALLNIICSAYCAEHPTSDALVDAAAEVYHLVEHTAFYYNSKVLWKRGL